MSWCAVVAMAATTATGCTDGTGGDGNDEGRDRTQRTTRTHPAALTWQQEVRVADALQRLTKQCMGRHGFAYWEDLGLTLLESRPVRFVQDDVAWARTYGYGSRIEAKSARVRESNPNGAYRQGLSYSRRAAFDVALDGGDSARMLTASLPGRGEIRKRIGGCTQEAERTLYGDPAEWFRTSKTALGLSSLYGKQLMEDRRLSAAVQAWSHCMKKAGQPYEDPQAARDAVRAETGRLGPAHSDDAFTGERATAVADATCARRVSLRAVATERETRYLDRLRDRYGEDIDAYRHFGRRAYERAVHIVPERD
ncbi:hypothetical protein C6Y14_14695 [Streptomyces dioscori]|uniref:Uncharacterized protein n=2 Tax=Streptomyces dioscori TaxID=2109333 RepID=A0A2P8Q880_9ACTN|nr:hypothetical protein C6Y14_14695 [Streptomyces dioscori]